MRSRLIDLCVLSTGYTCALVIELTKWESTTLISPNTMRVSRPHNRITSSSLIRMMRVANKYAKPERLYESDTMTCKLYRM